MAPLTFADTHNMIAFLSKSDASVGFNQIVDFLNAQVIQYALMVNLTIYVSCIKQFWAMVSIKKVNDVVKLCALIDGKRVVVTEDVIRHDLCLDDADGVECLPNEEIFTELACRKFNFLKYIFDSMYTSPALTQKVFANMRRVGKGFLEVKTLLFATMLVQPQPPVAKEEDEVQTYATLSQKVAHLEQDKIAQALEIIKLKKRVKKLEKTRRFKFSGLKRLRTVGDYLVEMETQANLGAELQGRKDDDNAAINDASAAEPTVFDDEEVSMTMAQTLIKMKAENTRLLDEQMAKRPHDEEIKQAAAREKQEKDDLEKAKVLQKHLKRKPISIAQARKHMIVYLKNIAGYKMEHFKGMTYNKVSHIFEREYNKVQPLFKPDKNEEPTKKRVVEETLLQESFKKLKEVKVSGSLSTKETPTDDPKEMSKEDVKNVLEIVPVSEFKVEALQVKYPLIDWEIHSEGSRSYWKIIRVGGIIQAYQIF
nr:hypothetical protein [Tanacetum cinerariifolium]